MKVISAICVACEKPMPTFEEQKAEINNPETGARRHCACEGKPLQVKVFQMNDCDWMAARTKQEATDSYKANFGGDEFEDDEAEELDDKEMQHFRFRDEDGTSRTFQDQLEKMIAEGVEFPTFFASTEY